jgi:hypothetical protein
MEDVLTEDVAAFRKWQTLALPGAVYRYWSGQSIANSRPPVREEAWQNTVAGRVYLVQRQRDYSTVYGGFVYDYIAIKASPEPAWRLVPDAKYTDGLREARRVATPARPKVDTYTQGRPRVRHQSGMAKPGGRVQALVDPP